VGRRRAVYTGVDAHCGKRQQAPCISCGIALGKRAFVGSGTCHGLHLFFDGGTLEKALIIISMDPTCPDVAAMSAAVAYGNKCWLIDL
jgi:hypothetical protein